MQARVSITLLALLPSGCHFDPYYFWKQLGERYGIEPGSAVVAQSTVKFVLMGRDRNQTERYDEAKRHLGDSAVFLEVGPGLLRPRIAVQIPVEAIRACSRVQWPSGWETHMWIEVPGIDIGFMDQDKEVSKWCQERELEFVDREIMLRWSTQ